MSSLYRQSHLMAKIILEQLIIEDDSDIEWKAEFSKAYGEEGHKTQRRFNNHLKIRFTV